MAETKNKISRRQEDYLEAVLLLVRRDGVARVRDIAQRTRVSKPSVTAALRHLSREGLVRYDPYEWVTLTPRGQAVGGRISAKHDTLRSFLIHVLGVDAASAEENACRMEHVVDDRVLARLTQLAEFIQSRPQDRRWLEEFAAYRRGPSRPGEKKA